MSTSHSSEQDEHFDAMLAKLRLEPIPNDGFSEKVMHTLPARRHANNHVLWVFAGIGALMATWQLVQADLLRAAMQDLQSGDLGKTSLLLLGSLLTLISWLAAWALSAD